MTKLANIKERIKNLKFQFLARRYFKSLLPIAEWLPRYNLEYFIGDLIAGITVGLVIIPQALSYAKLANVSPEYGLYTGFVGCIAYALFATSKDVTIGATAVLSQLIGQLSASYKPAGVDAVVWTASLCLLTGLVEAAIGLLRLGILVDLISVPVVVGFTSGGALQIIFGQLPGLLGIAGVNTNDAPWLVLYTTLSRLNTAKIDAAFGLATICLLALFRIATHFALKRGMKWFVWIGHSANVVTLILFTLFSWAAYGKVGSVPIKIVGDVPKGLSYIKVPDVSLFSQLLPAVLPVVLVGIIEHIAMAKAFGRLNGYRADPNQEIVALGVTNIIAPFFGAIPATGSFSRSSIKSRSGVKTPLAGFFTAFVVLLAICFVTPAFYFIPSATLSGIIIASITDLLARPATIKRLWDVEFFDFLSFLVGLVVKSPFTNYKVTIAVSIEVGIYAAVGFSLLVLLHRIARPPFNVLVREEKGNGWVGYAEVARESDKVPDATPFPGIPVFRVDQDLTYPNANHLSNSIKVFPSL